MSKQSQDALAAIERFVFQSDKPIVVALTGGWGEGKTYFWKEVVIPNHKDTKPGYVSVFGAESLAMIRERVAFSSAHLADFAKSGIIPEWMKKIGGPIVASSRLTGCSSTLRSGRQACRGTQYFTVGMNKPRYQSAITFPERVIQFPRRHRLLKVRDNEGGCSSAWHFQRQCRPINHRCGPFFCARAGEEYRCAWYVSCGSGRRRALRYRHLEDGLEKVWIAPRHEGIN